MDDEQVPLEAQEDTGLLAKGSSTQKGWAYFLYLKECFETFNSPPFTFIKTFQAWSHFKHHFIIMNFHKTFPFTPTVVYYGLFLFTYSTKNGVCYCVAPVILILGFTNWSYEGVIKTWEGDQSLGGAMEERVPWFSFFPTHPLWKLLCQEHWVHGYTAIMTCHEHAPTPHGVSILLWGDWIKMRSHWFLIGKSVYAMPGVCT